MGTNLALPTGLAGDSILDALHCADGTRKPADGEKESLSTSAPFSLPRTFDPRLLSFPLSLLQNFHSYLSPKMPSIYPAYGSRTVAIPRLTWPDHAQRSEDDDHRCWTCKSYGLACDLALPGMFFLFRMDLAILKGV